MNELIGVASAVLVATWWCAIAVRFGPKWGFVDLPDGNLKTHRVAAVPLGGVGVFGGFVAALLVTKSFVPLLTAAALFVLIVGLIDDRWGLSPSLRLVSAGVAGLTLAALEENSWRGLLIVAATVVCLNAINLLDGLDALAGSTSAVTLAGFGWLAAVRGQPDWIFPLLAAAAVAGFLAWNLPPARVFLGDNGAYVIGVLLAFCAFRISRNGLELAVAFALIGAPLFDLAVTVLRRFRAGSALFVGDRDHTYDRLRRVIGSTGRVATTFALGQAVWVVLLVIVEDLISPLAALIVAIVVGLVAVMSTTRPGPSG